MRMVFFCSPHTESLWTAQFLISLVIRIPWVQNLGTPIVEKIIVLQTYIGIYLFGFFLGVTWWKMFIMLQEGPHTIFGHRQISIFSVSLQQPWGTKNVMDQLPHTKLIEFNVLSNWQEQCENEFLSILNKSVKIKKIPRVVSELWDLKFLDFYQFWPLR